VKKDITTKDTIKTITQDIAKYILELDVSDIEFVDKELQRIEKREADIVAHCLINGVEGILHLEIQNDNDTTMHKRMLRYYNDISIRFDRLPIYQYLVYIGKPKLTMQEKILEDNLKFRYNIIDMHTIDCEKFLTMDSPDALVLAILCDFKGRDAKDVISYIIQRLQELTKDNAHKLGKCMLALEELSTNRDLQDKLKEVESMLRDMKFEDLPSYEIGMERGVWQTNMQNAMIMIQDFHISPKEVAQKLKLPLDEILNYIDSKKEKKQG